MTNRRVCACLTMACERMEKQSLRTGDSALLGVGVLEGAVAGFAAAEALFRRRLWGAVGVELLRGDQAVAELGV